MPKYTPLYDYLRRKPQSEIELSFVQVERIIKSPLPNSAALPQWWANKQSPASRHVQCSAWLDAGFEAFLMPGERVVFKRRR